MESNKTLKDFMLECELYPYSREHYEIMKECAQIKVTAQYLEDVNFYNQFEEKYGSYLMEESYFIEEKKFNIKDTVSKFGRGVSRVAGNIWKKIQALIDQIKKFIGRIIEWVTKTQNKYKLESIMKHIRKLYPNNMGSVATALENAAGNNKRIVVNCFKNQPFYGTLKKSISKKPRGRDDDEEETATTESFYDVDSYGGGDIYVSLLEEDGNQDTQVWDDTMSTETILQGLALVTSPDTVRLYNGGLPKAVSLEELAWACDQLANNKNSGYTQIANELDTWRRQTKDGFETTLSPRKLNELRKKLDKLDIPSDATKTDKPNVAAESLNGAYDAYQAVVGCISDTFSLYNTIITYRAAALKELQKLTKEEKL